MYIKELRLKNFGKFHDKEITLSDGINVIYGENEAGKSTIHAFIKGMFFGITRQRGLKAKDDAYIRYLPWNHPSQFDGSMDIKANDRTYRIYRNFHKDYREHRIIDLLTGKEIDINWAKENIFSGLTESNYKNTISMEQTKARAEKELAREIQNFVTNLSTSKNNEINVGKALESLKGKKKEIEAKDTDNQLLFCEQRKEEYEENKMKIETLTRSLKELESYGRNLENHINKKKELQKKLEHINLAIVESSNKLPEHMEHDLEELEELLLKEEEFGQKLNKLNDTNGKLDNPDLYNETWKDKKNIQTDLMLKFVFILALVALFLCGGALIVTSYMPFVFFIFVSLLAVVITGYLIQTNQKKKWLNLTYNHTVYKSEESKDEIISKRDETNRKIARILALYHVTDEKELRAKYDETLLQRKEGTVREDEKKELIQSLNELNVDSYEENYKDCMIQKEKIKWELKSLEDSQTNWLLCEEQYKNLITQKAEEEEEKRAIDIAMETIHKLSVQIQDEFGYHLNDMVSAILSKITEGKYSDVKIDENLNIKVGYENDFIDLEKLSIGTIEQVYFALRAATADLIFKEKRMPLILDESFVYYDEDRLKKILLELKHNQEKQIIIFTCHKREKEILEECKVPFHYIPLS